MANEKLYESLDRADPNTLADVLRYLGFGKLLSQGRTVLRNRNAVTGDQIVLPNHMKALVIHHCYARAGAGTPGELTIVTTGAPAAGEVSISAAGNIVFNAADDWTSVDVDYLPHLAKVVTLPAGMPVVTNALTIPASALPAVHLLSATGYTAAGVAVPTTPDFAGVAPAAGESALNAAKSQVLFNAADAVVTADVTLLVALDKELATEMDADSSFL